MMCQNRDGAFVESLGPYGRFIDECMVRIVTSLNKSHNKKTVACCCGHDKYPRTIIIEDKSWDGETVYFDIISGVQIPRTRNFYKMDSEGYYYIPETL